MARSRRRNTSRNAKNPPAVKSGSMTQKSDDKPATSLPKESPVTFAATEVYREHYAGPLPHPEILRQFDTIVPGSAEKIIKRFVEQGEHRQHLERTVIEGDVVLARWGLFCGFVIAVLGLGSGVFLIMQGHELGGGILSSVTLASIVGAFIYGTNSRRAERTQKAGNDSD